MSTLGILDAYWNGGKVPIEKGGTVKLGGVINKTVVFGKQVDSAGEMVASEVSVTAVVEAGVSITGTYSKGAGELQVHCDTGQIFSWDTAFLIDALEFSGGDGGKLKLKWNAGVPVEI